MTEHRPRRWTRREYHRLDELGVLPEDEPVELLDGQLVVAEPKGAPHATIVARNFALSRAPRGTVPVPRGLAFLAVHPDLDAKRAFVPDPSIRRSDGLAPLVFGLAELAAAFGGGAAAARCGAFGAGAYPAAWIRALLLLLLVAAAVYALLFGLRSVTITPEGLTLRTLLPARRIPWSEIAAVRFALQELGRGGVDHSRYAACAFSVSAAQDGLAEGLRLAKASTKAAGEALIASVGR